MDKNWGRAAVVLPIAALALTACRVNVDMNSFSDDGTITAAINRIDVNSTAGSVTVEIGTGPTTVHRDVQYGSTKPGGTTSVSGHTLNLSSCGNGCSVDYRIRVPAGTSVAGSVSSGSLTLTSVASVNVRSDSGNITVDNVTGDINADASAGSIDIGNAGGNVHAATESGDVTVSTATARDVDAQTSSGAIRLSVAPGAYRVTASTGSGNADVTVPNSPNGQHTLHARTDSGNIHISSR